MQPSPNQVRPKAIIHREAELQREQDYEQFVQDKSRKLEAEAKIVRIFREIRAGKLPSNAQIEQIMRSISLSALTDTSALSSEGKQFSATFDRFTTTIGRFIAEKNQNEELQEYLYNYTKLSAEKAKQQASQAASSVSNGLPSATSAINAVKAMQNPVQIGASDFFNAASTIITNAEFRQSIIDYATGFIDALTQESERNTTETNHGSNETQEDESETHKAEDFPEQGYFGESFGQSITTQSAPDIIDTLGASLRTMPRSPLKSQRSSQETIGSPLKNQMSPQASIGSPKAPPTPTKDVAKHGRGLSLTRSNSGTPTRVNSPLEAVKESDDQEKMTSETRWQEEGQAGTSEANGFEDDDIYHDQLSEKQRRVLAERYQAILTKLHSKPSYTKTLTTIVSFFRNAFDNTRLIHRDLFAISEKNALGLAGHLDTKISDNNKKVLLQTKAFIDKVWESAKLDPIIDLVKEIELNTKHDPAMRHFFVDLGETVEAALTEPSFVERDQFLGETMELIRRGRELFGAKQLILLSRIIKNSKNFIDEVLADEITTMLFKDIVQLNRDLFIDPRTEKVVVKTALIGDLMHVVVPAIMHELRYVPIPRIEFMSREYHVVAEDIVIDLSNLAPNLFEITLKNRLTIGVKEALGVRAKHQVTLKVYKINLKLKNIPFYFQRRVFPTMTEYGVVDADHAGEGICLAIKLGFDPTSPNRTITLKNCIVYIDKLILNFHDTSNDSLLRPMQSLVAFILKGKIRDAVQDRVAELVKEIDVTITEMKVKALDQFDGMSGGLGIFESLMRRGDPKRTHKQQSHDEVHTNGDAVKHSEEISVSKEWGSNAFSMGSQ